MADFSYDLVVIGSGPAGEGAAINAVKQGLRVAVVDGRASQAVTVLTWGPSPPRLFVTLCDA